MARKENQMKNLTIAFVWGEGLDPLNPHYPHIWFQQALKNKLFFILFICSQYQGPAAMGVKVTPYRGGVSPGPLFKLKNNVMKSKNSYYVHMCMHVKLYMVNTIPSINGGRYIPVVRSMDAVDAAHSQNFKHLEYHFFINTLADKIKAPLAIFNFSF